jgi:hypothetical protein
MSLQFPEMILKPYQEWESYTGTVSCSRWIAALKVSGSLKSLIRVSLKQASCEPKCEEQNYFELILQDT